MHYLKPLSDTDNGINMCAPPLCLGLRREVDVEVFTELGHYEHEYTSVVSLVDADRVKWKVKTKAAASKASYVHHDFPSSKIVTY